MATFLQDGDIAFSAFQSDNSGGGFNGDAFEFVLLVPVETGTTIYFTNNGYLTNTNTFRTGESLIRWRAQSNLPAGSVITFTAPGGIGAANTPQWTGINPVGGTPFSTAAFGLDTGGDNITALISPTFSSTNDSLSGTPIAALTFGSATFPSPFTTTSGINTTGLPLGLVDGTTAVSVGSTQNGRYNNAAPGSVESGSRNAIRSSLNNDAYWTVSADPLPTPFNTTATFSITTVSIAATDATATEAPGDTGTFRITRTGDITAALNVGLGVGGSAINGTDYTGVPSSVTISAGATSADITVTPLQDSLAELDETVNVSLAGGGSSYDLASPTSATVTISNSSPPPLPTVTIAATDLTASETANNSNPGVFRITRSVATINPLTVNYSVGGTATSADYTPGIGTSATIPANQTSVEITINPVDDGLVEGTETVSVTLVAGNGYTPNFSPATVSIADNDFPTVNLSLSSNSSSETNPAAITVTATASGAVFGNQTVALGVSGTGITIGDYTLSGSATPNVITILSGQATGTTIFTVVDDNVVENAETAILTLSNPSAGITLGSTVTQNIAIADNDVAPVAAVKPNDFNGDSKSDILWRNNDGSVAIWQMDGNTILPASGLVSAASPDWKIAGTGDFNNDSKSDILWRNNDGSVAIWQMDGNTILPASGLVSAASPDWKIAGTGDFNNDSKSDILWRNDLGAVAIWQMDGNTILPASGSIGSATTDWKIAGSPQTYTPPVFV
jgi:trimeric autotransporter adhesin